jgi:hypothetical protein
MEDTEMGLFNSDKAADIVIINVTKTAGGLFFKFRESELEKLNAMEKKQILITLETIKDHIAPQKRA